MSDLKYDELHQQLYASLNSYLDAKVVEKHTKWCEEDAANEGELREIFKEMGSHGWIMPWAEEEYGGCDADVLSSYVIAGAIGKKGLSGISVWLHGEMAGPYLSHYGTKNQKEKYLASAVSGENIACIAMTEPDAGSDLLALKSTAKKDGSDYIINGSKCFITNGTLADTVLVACKTDSSDAKIPAISLFIVDGDARGLTRRKIRKAAGNVSDTAELFFDNVRVPAENLLGEEGKAYKMLLQGLQHERLTAAANYQGIAERALELTTDYVADRIVFGERLADFQNTGFTLADLYTKVVAGRALIKDLSVKTANAENDAVYSAEVSAAKIYSASLAQECLRKGAQLHGGYGICQEYEIGRLNAEAASFSLAAGTSEIMKHIISRQLVGKKKER